jgi:hypothetical protein
VPVGFFLVSQPSLNEIQLKTNPMKIQNANYSNAFGRWSRLPKAIRAAGVILAGVSLVANTFAAQTLVEFNFDEGTGDTVTSKDGKLVGMLEGATFSTNSPSGKKGDFSLQFDTGQRVTVPDPDMILALDQADSSFTIQAWLKFENPTIARSVYFYNNGPGGALSASVTTDRRAFVTTLGIVDQTSTAFIPNDGAWHHIAVVHQFQRDLRFYIDGVLSATVAYTRGVIFTRTFTEFYFGAENTGGLQYVGFLDRFRYTKGALTPAELDYLAVPGVALPPPTLGIETAVKLSWPTLPPGYVLQSSTNLSGTAVWSNVTNTPSLDNSKYNVFLPASGTKSIFRLVKP